METAAEDPLAVLLAALELDIGVSWVCWACPVQGHTVHASVDAARHDAAGHALGVHRDRLALAQIALRLVSEEERRTRTDGTVAMVPPLEDPFSRPRPSPAQQQVMCDAIGCRPDARHRRHREPIGPSAREPSNE
ncbi:hypothetical protein OG196_43010 (plasmid) [Kitasatospora purpeofusca]|uniref:hypothetical protein n=1 Tax=Kitasatospora purpeofusca TaxID=67352 RepID=UPI002E0EF4DC|nr:hypothetical protein OG196_43010 [Kitasatospora purpeofusca]